jgi:putative transposase
VVTSNHIHLLVKDTGQDVIAQSMQLIAGRTAQEYNQRKGRGGAFWEDRYHATAIEADEHLHRCLVYIDLNMVRAIEYWGPFQLFQTFNRFAPFKTFQINACFKVQGSMWDLWGLTELSGFTDLRDFQRAHRQWVEQTVENGRAVRDDHWSQAIAIGSLAFVESVKSELGSRAMHRAVEQNGGAYALREPGEAYNGGGESEPLSLENTVLWNKNAAGCGDIAWPAC